MKSIQTGLAASLLCTIVLGPKSWAVKISLNPRSSVEHFWNQITFPLRITPILPGSMEWQNPQRLTNHSITKPRNISSRPNEHLHIWRPCAWPKNQRSHCGASELATRDWKGTATYFLQARNFYTIPTRIILSFQRLEGSLVVVDGRVNLVCHWWQVRAN